MDGCRNQRRIALFLAVLSFISLNAFADIINNEWYSSVRALSMGNAAIASADDPVTAMFYNPAMIAKVKKPTGEILNPHIEMGLGNFTLGKDSTGMWKQDLGNTTGKMLEHRNTGSYIGGSLYPYFATQNFSIGFLGRYEQSGYIDDNTVLHYRFRQLMMPTMALSMGLFSGRMKFGFAVRGIQAADKDATETQSSKFNQASYQGQSGEGFGWGLDAGWSLTMPWAGLPTIAAVARNIGDTSFPIQSATFPSFARGQSTPHVIVKGTYDIGMSFSPKFDRNKSLVFDVDYRDALLRNRSVNKLRRLNVGAELGLSKFFYLRLGARAGYWAGGIGLMGKSSTFDLGTYADELDPVGFMKVSDRRIALRYGSRF